MRSCFFHVFLVGILGLAGPPSLEAASLRLPSSLLEEGPPGPYQEGIQALDEGRWQDAILAFEQVVDGGGEAIDAALYWQAYALRRMGRRGEALGILEVLEREHPESRWLEEARVLAVEIRGAGAPEIERLEAPEEGDADLKLMAINSLMQMDPERALPLLERFLGSSQPTDLRERALFVMVTQSDSEHSRELLEQIVAGSLYPELQIKAVHFFGHLGGEDTHATLASVYESSEDREVKRAILESFSMSDAVEPVLAAARSEQDQELRKAAVEMLGVMGATDPLLALYGRETSRELKQAMIRVMPLGGMDPEAFLALIHDEKDAALRRHAIVHLGLLDAEGMSERLTSLYESETDEATRSEIIKALGLQESVVTLMELARHESVAALRREAVRSLGMVDAEEIAEGLLSLYQGEKDLQLRQEIIGAMAMREDGATLVRLARQETNPRLKRELVNALAMVDSEEARAYLVELIEE